MLDAVFKRFDRTELVHDHKLMQASKDVLPMITATLKVRNMGSQGIGDGAKGLEKMAMGMRVSFLSLLFSQYVGLSVVVALFLMLELSKHATTCRCE